MYLSPALYFFVLSSLCWEDMETQLPNSGERFRVKLNGDLIKSYCCWVEVEVHFMTACSHLIDLVSG